MASEGALLPCPGCGLAAVVPADGEDHPCASCGAILRLEAPAPPEHPPLATSFAYPFSRPGAVVFLATAAPVWGLVRVQGTSLFIGWGEVLLGHGGIFVGLVLHALFGGYVAVWLWEVLEGTAHGSDVPPPAPWPTDFAEFGRSFVHFAAAFATAFLPALVARGALGTEEPWQGAICGVLALAGMAYYPMSMLLVGLSGSWTGGLRIPTALRSMRLLGKDYALCCVFIAVSFGLSAALEHGTAALWAYGNAYAALGASCAAVFLELALYAVHMRAIGLVYRAHAKDLGWFRSRP